MLSKVDMESPPECDKNILMPEPDPRTFSNRCGAGADVRGVRDNQFLGVFFGPSRSGLPWAVVTEIVMTAVPSTFWGEGRPTGVVEMTPRRSRRRWLTVGPHRAD